MTEISKEQAMNNRASAIQAAAILAISIEMDDLDHVFSLAQMLDDYITNGTIS